jgi:hypothetical protein
VDEEIKNLMRWLIPNPALSPDLLEVSQKFYDLALDMNEIIAEVPEKVHGLRFLLQAKDCMVRARMDS